METVWASSFDNTAIAAATGVLYGCVRLVGGSCFVPTNTSGATALALGPAGVLTDPAGDARTWVWAHRYGDGELVITADPTPAANRVLDTSGRLCANAHYNAVGCAPWYEARAGMRYCELDASLRGLALESMDYWFYSNTDLALVYGWENVAGLASMRMTFNGCTALGALYLTGLDPSGLRDLFYTFALCTMLEAIYVDATWALPAACMGMATFYNCTRLKGGNGTAYSSAATGASMAVIDGAGSPGYLTGA